MIHGMTSNYVLWFLDTCTHTILYTSYITPSSHYKALCPSYSLHETPLIFYHSKSLAP